MKRGWIFLLGLVGIFMLAFVNTAHSDNILYFDAEVVNSTEDYFLGMTGSGSVTYSDDPIATGPPGTVYTVIDIDFYFEGQEFDDSHYDGTPNLAFRDGDISYFKYGLEEDVNEVDFVTEGLVSINFALTGTYDSSTDRYFIELRANQNLDGIPAQAQEEDGDQTSSVPEPTTMLLFGSGLIGLAGFRRRFRKRYFHQS